MKKARLIVGVALVLLFGYGIGSAHSQPSSPQQRVIWVRVQHPESATASWFGDVPALKAEIENGWRVSQISSACVPGMCNVWAILEKR
ncbi:MAG TPA: hypothetical protein VGS00_11355 [Thermoanaerobaculia bacterium]|nr:hypothetical protein [Thermoanaerobaculia bacterium]